MFIYVVKVQYQGDGIEEYVRGVFIDLEKAEESLSAWATGPRDIEEKYGAYCHIEKWDGDSGKFLEYLKEVSGV